MVNNLQKFIYNLSSVAPLCFVFALVWYLQKGTLKIPIICISSGLVLIFCFGIFFSYGRKNVATIIIRVNDISPNDGWVALYIISYMLPFTSMAIKDFDVVVCAIIAVLLTLIVPYINTAIPNPLLFCRKYHFYQIGAENGVSGYVLISRRKLRKAKDVKTVKRIFKFLLVDTERK